MKKEKQKKAVKKGINEFKEFISKGNVIDMAVGVIIGGAFGKIVTSLVDKILMPIIGVIIGGHDFSSLSIKVGTANIAYGAFIQSVVDFLIVAFCLFLIIKLISRIKNIAKKEEAEEVSEEQSEEIALLTEIRDLLKEKK